jgi:predicted transcriptional regulator
MEQGEAISAKNRGRILFIQLPEDLLILKGLASEVRLKILEVLRHGEKNVNEIKKETGFPQSTIAMNIMLLEKAQLIETRNIKAAKGTQKICSALYDEFVVELSEPVSAVKDAIEVEMPIGLFIECSVSPPCGMCSVEKIIGFLDTPRSFLEPERVKAGLLWFEKGYVVYQFPNNAFYLQNPVKRLEVGTWISPGDFGDKRGTFTPEWWKLEGSQYGLNKVWSVTENGSFIDGVPVSPVNITDLKLSDHHSVKVKIGIKENADHVGGVNIFGRGFGNYDRNIVLRMHL